MKVVHVVENWGIGSGGVYAAIEPLLSTLNFAIDTIVLTNKNTSGENKYIQKFQGYFFSFKLNKTLLWVLVKNNPDIVHIHGLWTLKSLVCLCYSRLASKKLIISPHGMLTPKAFSKSIIKKLFIYFLYERLMLKSANLIHLLNEAERSDSSRFLSGKKIAIVANPAVQDHALGDYKIYDDRKSILFLGRVSRLKGVLELINGWVMVKDYEGYRECVLDIVGWGDDFQELSQLKIVSDKSNRIFFHGPVFGKCKTELFLKAKLFALPSFTEGQPMAVLEAIVCKTPVMISRQCNLNFLESIDGFEIVEPTADSIAAWLKNFIKLNLCEINQVTEEAYKLVMQNYAIEKITELYLKMYKNA